MKLKIVYVEENNPEDWYKELSQNNKNTTFYLDGEEVYYFIEVEQMPNKDWTLCTNFNIGFCVVTEIYYNLKGEGHHEVYIKEK